MREFRTIRIQILYGSPNSHFRYSFSHSLCCPPVHDLLRPATSPVTATARRSREHHGGADAAALRRQPALYRFSGWTLPPKPSRPVTTTTWKMQCTISTSPANTTKSSCKPRRLWRSSLCCRCRSSSRIVSGAGSTHWSTTASSGICCSRARSCKTRRWWTTWLPSCRWTEGTTRSRRYCVSTAACTKS